MEKDAEAAKGASIGSVSGAAVAGAFHSHTVGGAAAASGSSAAPAWR